jgi:hypothetical protein
VDNEQEEHNCKACGKAFYEFDNFAWSCRMHRSEFGGQIWWCCGKEGRDSAGCQLRRHEAKNDEDRLIDQSADKQRKKACIVRSKQNCKEPGHLVADCPKDPNPKGQIEILNQEIVRLKSTSRKRKANKESDNLQERAISELQIDFRGEFENSSESALNSSGEMQSAKFFTDVMKAKEATNISRLDVSATQDMIDLHADIEALICPANTKKSTKSARIMGNSAATRPKSRVRFNSNAKA